MRRANLFVLIALFGSLLAFSHAYAADVVQQPYQLLAPLPLNTPSGPDVGTTNATQYIIGIIKLVIAVAGGLAVIKIVIAGIQYMTSDAFSGKSSARQGINDALIGLLLVISSYVILYTINPSLVNFDLRIAGQNTGSALGLNVGDQPGAGNQPAKTGTCNSDPGSPCVSVSSYLFPKKGPGGGGGCAAGDNCYLNKDLADKLQILTKNLNDNDHITQNDWIVTEMDPPADPDHASSCHLDGTCVDAKLNAANPTPQNIAAFLKEITSTVGPSFLYEPASCARYKQLVSAPALAPYKDQIKVCKTTTGENVHINLSGGTGGSCGNTNVNGVATSNEVTCP